MINKKKSILYVLCDDLLKEIAHFLDNQTIIELLVSSYNINKKMKCKELTYDKDGYLNIYKHLFTSITVKPHHNLTDFIQHYINHSKTIRIQHIHPQLHNVWPFFKENKKDKENKEDKDIKNKKLKEIKKRKRIKG